MGLTFGIATDFKISDKLSLTPELNFTQKGASIKGGESDDVSSIEGKTTFTLNYIELPILAKLNIGSTNIFHLNFGSTLGYWIGGRNRNDYTLTFAGNTSTSSFNQKLKFGNGNDDDKTIYIPHEDAKRLEIALSAGGGLTLYGITIDLRYTYGLTDIFDLETGGLKHSKHNLLSISAIYPLKL